MPLRKTRISAHAFRQLTRRHLSDQVVLQVARDPTEVMHVRPGREMRQSTVVDRATGKSYPLRSEADMKVLYDEETDTLTVIFRDVPVAESDEEKPGIVLDYDGSGNLVSIEVLDASTRVEDPRSVIVSTSARP